MASTGAEWLAAVAGSPNVTLDALERKFYSTPRRYLKEILALANNYNRSR
jgi:hypothetical protein